MDTLSTRTAAAIAAYRDAKTTAAIQELDLRCLRLISECTEQQADDISRTRANTLNKIGEHSERLAHT